MKRKSTTVNEIIDRNTYGCVLYKCIEKGGNFLKYFVGMAAVVVEVIKLLGWYG